MANSLVRFAAMYGPILGVGVVCGGYFWDCLQEVFSPSTGFKIDYQTEAGLVNLQCQNYSFDPLGGTLVAQSFEVRHPNGKLIARLPKLLVTGLRIDQRLAPQAMLQDAEVWVRRKPDGKIDLERYFPKPSEEGSTTPFSAELYRCRINFMDEAAAGVPSNQLYVTHGTLNGLGDNLFGNLKVNLVGLASADVRIDKSLRGLGLIGSNVEIKPGAVRNRLLLGPEKRAWFELEKLKVGEGTIRGDFQALIPPKQPFSLVANLGGSLTGLGWDTYIASKSDLKVTVTEHDAKFIGILSESNAGAKIGGVVDWKKGVKLDGAADLQRVTPALLNKMGVALPNWLKVAEARVQGRFGLTDGVYSFRGKAIATSVSAYDIKMPVVASQLEVDKAGLKATWDEIAVGTTKTQGAASYQFANQKWQVAAKSDAARADDFLNLVPAQLKGTSGSVSVVGGGTGSKVDLLISSRLDAKVAIGDRRLDLKNTEILGRFDGKAFRIERASTEGPNGNLVASGTIDLKRGLSVDLEGSGLVLSQFMPDLSGEADIKGRLVGSLTKPRFDGLVQAIELGYGDFKGALTAVAAEALIDVDGVSLSHVLGVKGAGQVSGDLGLKFKSGALSGMLSAGGVNISDFYEGQVAGVVDLKDIKIAGTASSPQLSGLAEAPTLLASSAKLTNVSAGVSLEGSKIRLEGAIAKVADGNLVDGSMTFDLKSKVGTVSGKAQKLSFAEIRQIVNRQIGDGKTDILGDDLEVKGTTDAEFSLSIRGGKVDEVKASGNVDSLKFNQATIGAGDWKVGYDGQSVKLDAMLGSLDDYFQLTGGNYNLSTKKLNGEVVAYNVPIHELVLAGQSKLEKYPSLYTRLNSINGKMGLSASLGGTTANPVLSLDDFEVANLKLGDENLGTVSMKGAYSGEGWRISDGSIVGPKTTKLNLPWATIKLSEKQGIPDGTAKFTAGMTKEAVDGKLELVGFPLSKFAPLLGENSAASPAQNFLAKSSVRIDYADLRLSGTPDDPALTADVESSLSSGAKTGPLAGDRLRAKTKIKAVPRKNSDLVDVSQESTLSFKSLEALFTTSLPVSLGDSDQQAQPIQGEFALAGERNLNEFLSGMKDLKLGAKGATISGGYKFGGTLGTPQATGAIKLAIDQAQSTAINPVIGAPVQVGLKDTLFELGFDRDARGLLARLKGSTGVTTATDGAISFAAAVSLADLNKSVMDLAIEGGFVNLDRIRLAQIFPDGSYANATITTPKNVEIGGTLGAPRISGELVATNVASVIPTLLPSPGGDDRLPIDPTFDLTYRIGDVATIKSSAADMRLGGSGNLRGKLSNLSAEARLVVEGGTLTLPGARIKLQPDGTLDFSYRADRLDGKARMVAKLLGDTSVTSVKNGTTPQRYDLTVGVDGDLLDTGFGKKDEVAFNDKINEKKNIYSFPNRPADLTDDDIFSLLGRTDLIKGVLQPGSNSQIEEEIRNAGIGFALPTFLGGFTNRLAQNFGFEYVSVDYNAFEQASLSAAKSLGSGFFLQGRRQISTPLPGQQTAYDFRLVYRPRSGPQSIRNLSFSLGTDQIRPYKLSVDFSQRIRTSKPPYRSFTLGVPPK